MFTSNIFLAFMESYIAFIMNSLHIMLFLFVINQYY